MKPANGLNYYQLIELDKDGLRTILGTKTIDFTVDNNKAVSIFPNPITDLFKVQLPKNIEGNVTVSLWSTTGITIFRETKLVDRSGTISVLMPAGTETGNYLLKIEGEGINTTLKILKK